MRLTVVPDEGAAEALCGLLRSEGIRCAHVATDASAEALSTYQSWREVLVADIDLPRARELLAAEGPSPEAPATGRGR